jgi:hypothetical protein
MNIHENSTQITAATVAAETYLTEHPAHANVHENATQTAAQIAAATAAAVALKTKADTVAWARSLDTAPPLMATAVAGEIAKFRPAPVNVDLIVNTSTTVSARDVIKTTTQTKRYGVIVAT